MNANYYNLINDCECVIESERIYPSINKLVLMVIVLCLRERKRECVCVRATANYVELDTDSSSVFSCTSALHIA